MAYELFLDTSELGTIHCTLLRDGKQIAEKRVTAKDNRNSSILLRAIDALLRSKKLAPNNLDGIAVVEGPGPFTALRVGVTVANALAWALQIPVVGVSSRHLAPTPSSKERGFARKGFRPVMPVYGREPNITIARKSVTSHRLWRDAVRRRHNQ